MLISFTASIPSGKAGYWGESTEACDTPVYTFDHMFKHIAENEKVCIAYICIHMYN